MEKQYLLVLCITLLAGVIAQDFTADIEISNIPNVYGVLTGKMYYSFGQKKIRIDYNVQGTGRPIEIIDYNPTAQVRYLGCTTKCQAESYKSGFPVYHRTGSDNVPGGAGCGTNNARGTVGDKQVKYVRFTSAGVPCIAELNDATIITFSNVVTTTLAASYFDVSSWQCPAKTCNIRVDLVIVLDCSGSVAGEWRTETNFAYNLANSFVVGTQAVMIGLVTFASSQKIEFNLLSDKGSVLNGINNADNRGGSTCIGCGLKTARDILGGSIARAGVQKMIVLVTDGQNNVGSGSTDINTATAYAKTGGTWIFVIGVTTAIDANQLKRVASSDGNNDGFYTINGQRVQTYFSAPNWSDLSNIVSTLITATCQDLPGNPCGTGCHGFCSCDKQCVCPDKCPSPNSCTVAQCQAASNGAGCYNTPKNCADNDACTIDTCDTGTTNGCVNTFSNVCPYRKCHTSRCVSPVGCVYTPVDCTDNNPCTDNFCNTTTDACDFRVVPCNLCQARGLNATVCQQGKNGCDVWDCVQPDFQTADCQIKSQKNCDDGNACTTDSCDRNTGDCVHVPVVCNDGDACTDDSCNPGSGCVFDRFNATERCDDLNVCTIDSCDSASTTFPGCVHDLVSCPGGDYCTTLQCNPVSGCEVQPVNCAALPDFADKIGSGACYVAECNDGSDPNTTLPYLGCNLRQIAGTTIDKCGVCDGDGTSCFLGVGVATAAGIGAGVLAAIIIGVVVGVAIVGTIAGKKGYDAYMRHRREMMGAQNNALYVDPGTSGNNPFYGTEMKPR